ncbi:MAG: hypothetical protein KatS3mg087_1083 [Patescibacteria group bacterium]|nr:MAG: hypothetical protein KatS3mg087_1083 [Patescibacteria group bacterium]
MATPIIEAPVVGAKVLRISDRGYLRSPAVRTDDWPFSPRGYFSPRGFFFWAFPPVILDVAYPLAPGYALAIVQVLPHDAPGAVHDHARGPGQMAGLRADGPARRGLRGGAQSRRHCARHPVRLHCGSRG